MSSRALRKVQKEQELEKQLAAVREAEAAQAEQDEESEEEVVQPPQKKPLNAFNMLDGMDDDEEDDEEDPEPTETKQTVESKSIPSQPSRSKKKKKKAKKKDKGKAESSNPTTNSDMDEIDRALKELLIKNHQNTEVDAPMTAYDVWLKEATKLLAIDTKNLNPVNEMKSLFGNIALEGTSSPARNPRRREQEQAHEGGMDLGTALSGRQCEGTQGKELGPLAHRRNVFMQGREEWPGATSGGLSMDYEKDESSLEKRYHIMHDKYYQETQIMFMQCVQTMEPQNLIALLRRKPYHIATLLQVSEIAKVQGDHFVSGDLIERALFNFGRSVHSTFGVAVKEGTARLTFSKPANRELYLSIWRYIRNLEQRGTWKTAFEWAKVLLQLEPAKDPYGVTLMIDQLALRGRQHVAFIEMCGDSAYGEMWNHLPNIQISLALAHQRNKEPTEARRSLAIAIQKYPYILSELAKSLDIDPLPRSLWGKLPSTDAETLYTQLYVTRAKDLWNTPELTSLLVEVAETLDHYKTFINASRRAPKLEISLEEARHVLLLEIPALIGLLPRKFTNMRTSMSDPLPPPDRTGSSDFTARAPAGADGSESGLARNVFGAAGGAAGGLLDRILGWWHTPADGSNANAANDGDQHAALEAFANQLGVELEEAQDMLTDFLVRPEETQARAIQGALNEGVRGEGMEEFMEDVMARIDGGDADSDDDLPELESIPGIATPPNPMAATVEEDEDEDVQPRNAASTGALLRHVDSDDDEPHSIANMARDAIRRQPADFHPHPEPTHTILASTSRNSAQAPIIEPTVDIEETSDPQRIQRWLLSAGFDGIKDGSSMANYVNKLKILPKPQRDWTIRMVEQRGGKDLAGRVRAGVED
jgi:tetratricopeptide (TPR) repeat protein